MYPLIDDIPALLDHSRQPASGAAFTPLCVLLQVQVQVQFEFELPGAAEH